MAIVINGNYKKKKGVTIEGFDEYIYVENACMNEGNERDVPIWMYRDLDLKHEKRLREGAISHLTGIIAISFSW